MRFTPGVKITEREINGRRIAASRRALNRQAEKLPLFAAEIRESQPDPVDRIRLIDAGVNEMWQGMRDLKAEQWRKGRKVLFAMHVDARRDLLDKWKKCSWPGDAPYFNSFVRRYQECGFVYLDKPPEAIQFDRERLAATIDRLRVEGQQRKEVGFRPEIREKAAVVGGSSGFMLKSQE